jgi:hypothetical protein
MRLARLGSACLLVLVACSGSTPRVPDGGDLCTGQPYDPCNTEHDCQSGNCRPFAAENITVCTVACDSTTPCPKTADGSAVMCDQAGLCEPMVANSCHIPP